MFLSVAHLHWQNLFIHRSERQQYRQQRTTYKTTIYDHSTTNSRIKVYTTVHADSITTNTNFDFVKQKWTYLRKLLKRHFYTSDTFFCHPINNVKSILHLHRLMGRCSFVICHFSHFKTRLFVSISCDTFTAVLCLPSQSVSSVTFAKLYQSFLSAIIILTSHQKLGGNVLCVVSQRGMNSADVSTANRTLRVCLLSVTSPWRHQGACCKCSLLIPMIFQSCPASLWLTV